MWILLVFVCASKINADAYLKKQGDILTCTVKNSESAIFWTNQDDEYLPAKSISENAYEVNELNGKPISSYHAGRLIPILPTVVDQRWENFNVFNETLIDIERGQIIFKIENVVEGRNDHFCRIVWKNNVGNSILDILRRLNISLNVVVSQLIRSENKSNPEIVINFYSIYRKKNIIITKDLWNIWDLIDYGILNEVITQKIQKDFHYQYYLYHKELSFNVTLSITGDVNCIKLYYYMCTSCNMSLNLDGVTTQVYYSNNSPNGRWHTINICREKFITNSSVFTVLLKTNSARFQFKFWALSSLILFNSATCKYFLYSTKSQEIHNLKKNSKISCNVLETGTKLSWDPVNYINETCEDICSICSGDNCFKIYSPKKSSNYLIAALISSLIISIFLICTFAYMMVKKIKGKAEENSSNVQELNSSGYEPIPMIQLNSKNEIHDESNGPIYDTILEDSLPTNSQQVEPDIYYSFTGNIKDKK